MSIVRSHVVSLSLALSLLSACSGSASYTRFRHEASEGQLARAEELYAADFLAYHAQEDAPRPPLLAGEASAVLVEALAGNPHLPPSGGRAVIQVSLRGGAAMVRQPSNVVVVLDLSGSMRDGDKIGAVRHALARFLETLDASDQLAIVTFADEAHVALAPSRVGEARDTILGAIGGLSAYGGTNLDAGLRAGVEVAAAVQAPLGVTRVVLLSDGVATVGNTDPHVILEAVRPIAARGMSLTTVGMGDQIDDALLRALAVQTGGAYHYLDQPSEVERVFATELRAITEQAARDVRVHVALPAGWVPARLHDRSTLQGGVIETPLGDLGGDEAIVVLHELDVPSGADGMALDVAVTYAGPSGGARVEAHSAVEFDRLGALPYDPAPGGSTLRNLALVRVADALRNADLRSRSGDRAGAAMEVRSALAQTCTARARLAQQGDALRAGSLDEPAQLLARTAQALPSPVQGDPLASPGGSAAFAGWRTDVATQPALGCP